MSPFSVAFGEPRNWSSARGAASVRQFQPRTEPTHSRGATGTEPARPACCRGFRPGWEGATTAAGLPVRSARCRRTRTARRCRRFDGSSSTRCVTSGDSVPLRSSYSSAAVVQRVARVRFWRASPEHAHGVDRLGLRLAHTAACSVDSRCTGHRGVDHSKHLGRTRVLQRTGGDAQPGQRVRRDFRARRLGGQGHHGDACADWWGPGFPASRHLADLELHGPGSSA